MSWRYDLYGSYCDDSHEWETGFDSEEEAKEAIEDRIAEIVEDNDLDPDEESDFDWSISEEEEDLGDMYPNADSEELEEELMDIMDKY